MAEWKESKLCRETTDVVDWVHCAMWLVSVDLEAEISYKYLT